jgi:hypothetical protein
MAPKKGSHISRLELEVVELIDAFSELMQKFNNAGWFEFCCAFRVTMRIFPCFFVNNFDGFETVVGNVLIHVTEHSIGAACRLSVYGERWWKKDRLPTDLPTNF